MNFQETVQYLYTSLPVFQHSGGAAYKPGLQTISELDVIMGSPHNRYATIHIAGTNGKGSVSHMLAAALQQSGYKTGLFTSPHLIDFRERIKVNGEMITESYVVEFVERYKSTFEKIQPSFFEVTTAMAFEYFAYNQVDIAIIETGMGGRLDATNIITPVMSIITNVSFDHTQFLGKQLTDIAFEKAGIIKTHVPVVIGETLPESKPVFQAKAKELNCPITFADEEIVVTQTGQNNEGQWMDIRQHGKTISVLTDLRGTYQRANIVTVLAALECLHHYSKFNVPEECMIAALSKTSQITGLRGRWQMLNTNPYTVCDTGHNPAGLSWVVQQISKSQYRKLHMVIGFVKDKDISEILQLLPQDATYYFTKASIERSLDESTLADEAKKYKLYGQSYPTVAEAMHAAFSVANPDDMIFIGGSTFVVADCLQANRLNF